jgi:hypothetical protein
VARHVEGVRRLHPRFEETEHGWIWAHAYRFAPDCSTFIVECSRRHGQGSASTG